MAFDRLSFDWMVVRAVENQKVDFVEARVAVVIEMRLFTVVNPTLEKFYDDEVLKETTAVVDLAQSFGRRNFAQPGGKACVGKKSFGRLTTVCESFSGIACSR